ncbi:MAG: nucleotide exchange factor GrpE, partial [Vicinamibacteria bacterium]
MTEDRDNNGTDRGPGTDDPIPSQAGDPFAVSDEANDLEELVDVLRLPAEPDEPGEPEAPDQNDEGDPTLAPELLESSVRAVEPQPQLDAPSATHEARELRKQVEAKDAQLAQVMTAYRALKKETERLRKRIETHQKRRFEQSKNDFIGHFVEVLDNLDRAIDSIESNFDSDSVLEGIILVRSRLVQLLREEGLEKIFVGGQSFDPTHSEAAGIEPVGDPSQDNVVLKELQR